MELLTPDAVHKQRTEGQNEVSLRTNAAAREEARIIHEMNISREKAIKEKQKIVESTQQFLISYEKKKNDLLNEVTELERRRAIALQPIEMIKAQADKMLFDAQERALTLDKKEQNLITREDKILDDSENLLDKENVLQEREQRVVSRETFIKFDNERLKKSADSLSTSWLSYHQAVSIFNTESNKKTTENNLVSLANQKYHEVLEKREHALAQREHNLRSQYAALEQAREEILGRKE